MSNENTNHMAGCVVGLIWIAVQFVVLAAIVGGCVWLAKKIWKD